MARARFAASPWSLPLPASPVRPATTALVPGLRAEYEGPVPAPGELAKGLALKAGLDPGIGIAIVGCIAAMAVDFAAISAPGEWGFAESRDPSAALSERAGPPAAGAPSALRAYVDVMPRPLRAPSY